MASKAKEKIEHLKLLKRLRNHFREDEEQMIEDEDNLPHDEEMDDVNDDYSKAYDDVVGNTEAEQKLQYDADRDDEAESPEEEAMEEMDEEESDRMPRMASKITKYNMPKEDRKKIAIMTMRSKYKKK